ncbi:MAG: hypothetical protein K0R54_109 [Clostridiaceae bacterium]|jgi:sugar phosphate isomerase/epimerase|nr:hypothetical protein [Clostridiaceae bacterium]
MIIGCKSALIETQLIDRKNKGVEYIEIHAFIDDFTDINSLLNRKNLLLKNKLKAYCVHAPIVYNTKDQIELTTNNEELRKENDILYKKVIQFANEFCDVPNPIVVIHPGGLFMPSENQCSIEGFYKEQRDKFHKEISEIQNFITENYPNVIVAIENNVRYLNINNNTYMYAYGFEDDIVSWIYELDYENIGTTLDIRNCMSVIDYNLKNNIKSDFIKIEDFIDAYIPNLKLIHLSKGYIDTIKHGQAFFKTNKEDIDCFEKIFKKLNNYRYNGAVTIETNEINIDYALNYLSTKKQ